MKACIVCFKSLNKRVTPRKYCFDCLPAVQEIQREVKVAMRGAVLPPLNRCRDCGKPATDYDHRLYAKPLQVDPVCSGCNTKRGPADDVAQLARIKLGIVLPDLVTIFPKGFNMDSALKQAERDYIDKAINYSGGNISKAAQLLGINRTTLYSRIDALKIEN